MFTIIREARPEDLAEIVELCRLHAEYEQSEYSETGKAALLHDHFFAEVPAAYCLVVEQSGKLIGYATYTKQFSTWDANFYIYMDCLFMREAARGQGLGESLVNHIKAAAKEMGCNLIQWQTPDFNVRAIKFYKRIGAIAKPKERFFLQVD